MKAQQWRCLLWALGPLAYALHPVSSWIDRRVPFLLSGSVPDYLAPSHQGLYRARSRLDERRRRPSQYGSPRTQQQQQLHLEQVCDEETVTGEPGQTVGRFPTRSQIRSLRSFNLAGVVNAHAQVDANQQPQQQRRIYIPIQDGHTLVSVTGETGSGKSLLVAKVVDLLTGGKASPSYLTGRRRSADHSDPTSPPGGGGRDHTAYVEMELLLRPPHLERVQSMLQQLGLDSWLLHPNKQPSLPDSPPTDVGILFLRRTLLMFEPPSSSSPQQLSSPLDRPSRSNSGNRSTPPPVHMRSVCHVNGQLISLKNLTALASPLLAMVDSTAASWALASREARLAMVDRGVSAPCLRQARQTQQAYRRARNERERLERELQSRTLPKGFVAAQGEKDVELMTHWIHELDAFEKRLMELCSSLIDDEEDAGGDTELAKLGSQLSTLRWTDTESTMTFTSTLYQKLSEFRSLLKSLDDRIVAARQALASLASLSETQSVAAALERSRDLLYEAMNGSLEPENERVLRASERSHELMNSVENALRACTKFFEDDDRGLIGTLERIRGVCFLSVEDIDLVLQEWNTLARKHGISPLALPACHSALKYERDGNVEARALLPAALAAEQAALRQYEKASAQLSVERQQVAHHLSSGVNDKLPALGMERSLFRADILTNFRQCSDASAYQTTAGSSPAALGLDAVDFLLLHGDRTDQSGKNRGGEVHEVASSGEKARILLAIECVLPGAIGASCSKNDQSLAPGHAADGEDFDSHDLGSSVPPVAVVYDEIDAHVGGRAAVAMAEMLAYQSRSSQVIAITHSPSVAAMADAHVVIQRESNMVSADKDDPGVTLVRADTVQGAERRRELARMASGDVAVEEAEAFAEALMREGSQRRRVG